MKLTWLIIAKDFRRLRWTLLGWLALFIAQVGVGLGLLQGNGADLDWLRSLQFVSMALVTLQAIGGFLLVARVVHEDGLIGTNEVWRTRPISRGRLLTAKVLGIGLMFGLLPVLILLPWWLVCGFGWREIEQAAAVALGWQLLAIIPGMWLAALTSSIARLLLWAFVIAMWLLAMALMMTAQGRASVSAELAETRWWLALLVGLATGGIVTMHQFLTLRLRWSVALTVVGLGLVGGIMQFWPWSRAEMWPPTSRPKMELAANMRIKPGAAQVQTNYSKDALTGIALRFTVEGVPEELEATGLKSNFTWRWPDGKTVVREGTYAWGVPYFTSWNSSHHKALGLVRPEPDDETERWMEQLRKEATEKRGAKFIKPDPQFKNQRLLEYRTLLPDAVIARMQQKAPVYQAAVETMLTRPELVAELQPNYRARREYQAKTFRIAQIPPGDGKRLVVYFVATAPNVQSETMQKWQRGLSQLSIDPDVSAVTGLGLHEGVYAVSRATGELTRFVNQTAATAHIAGVKVSWGMLDLRWQPKVRRGGTWAPRYERWFESLALCIFQDREVTRVRDEVTVEHFKLKPKDYVGDSVYAD